MGEIVKLDQKRDTEIPGETKTGKRIGEAKYVNFAKGQVVFDNIRKEINNFERKLEKKRVEKYDYLSGEYLKKVLAEECAKAGIPVDTFEAKSLENVNTVSPIALEASPMPVPKISSAVVGWRSSRVQNTLEFVGPLYVSPKLTIEPPLRPGEFRVTDQKFIFLG